MTSLDTVLVVMFGISQSFFLYVTWFQYRCVRKVRPRNRTVHPPMLWLNAVPFFNYVHGFVSVEKVRQSLRAEFEDHGAAEASGDYGREFGHAALGCWAACAFMGPAPAVPAMVLALLYVDKLRRYSRRLSELGGDEGADAEDEPGHD